MAPTFQVLEPIKYNGERYAPGESITLTTKVAAELRGIGAIAGSGIVNANAFLADGSPLPENFPGRELLEAAGFTTLEQLAGKSADDLTQIKGIGPATAKTILTALEELKA